MARIGSLGAGLRDYKKMAKILKTKETNKYIFTISRVIEREVSEQEKWNMEHGLGYVEKAPDLQKTIVWEGEYEVKEKAVIDILKALLEQQK